MPSSVKLPKLLTHAELASYWGWGEDKLRRARHQKRLVPAPQLVGGFVWVYAKETKLLRNGLDPRDPMVNSLPVEFISEEVPVDEARIPPKAVREGVFGPKTPKMVRLWGFEKMMRTRSMRSLEAETGLHYFTLRRIREGKKVLPQTAWKIAANMGVDVEDLLRR